MAFNRYIGWSQADLETALRAAQVDDAAGKSTTGAGDGNVMVKNSIDISPGTRIYLILKALNRIAPLTYPPQDITPITTARVVFGAVCPSSGTAAVTAANAITYSGPPAVAPPYIAAIVVDVDGRQWMYWGNAWH